MNSIVSFPAQKVSSSQKTKEWYKKCIDVAINMTTSDAFDIRKSAINKAVNYDLANGIINEGDIENVFNPLGLAKITQPAKTQNYPVEQPMFNILVGEESRRKFQFLVRCTNENAISEIEDAKKQIVKKLLIEEIQNAEYNEDNTSRRVKNLVKYLKYEYQDIRELVGTRILDYLWKEQDLKIMFNRAFSDVLIAGEEIYCADIFAKEPVAIKCNPLGLHTIGMGDSYKIEDATTIIDDGYIPVGQAIDYYYNELTSTQVSELEEGRETNVGSGELMYDGVFKAPPVYDEVSGLISVNSSLINTFSGAFDNKGNVRRTRVVWLSRRKLGILTYIDEMGDEQKTEVDEYYKIDKDKGETVKWIWINEWHEGTKLGNDIYLKMQPREIQFRNMSNLSKCSSGYVGTIYNTNSSKVVSLMDRVKPYKYLYNVFWRRTELAFAKNKGPIVELDIRRFPDDNVDKWMHYAENMGYSIVDSFREGTKGAATGKLVGQNTTGSKVLNAEMGNYISQHMGMLDFIERSMAKIAGITPQRLGMVSQRETVGGVERAVTQSSHITEEYYMLHDNTKCRFLTTLLETAKCAWKDNKKKLQYVDDDAATIMFEVDGQQFNESEQAVFITDGSEDEVLRQNIDKLIHAGLQTDKINFGKAIDLFSNKSISSKARDIEIAEEEAEEKRDKMQQAMMEAENKKVEEERTFKREELETKERIADKEMANERYIADRKLGKSYADLDKDGIPDILEVEKLRTNEREAERKRQHESTEKEKDRQHKSKESEKDRKIKVKSK